MDIMRLLAERRTFRRFAQTPIPADVIADVIEAVRLSSCGANRQALRLVIADQASDVSRIHPLVRGRLPAPGPRHSAAWRTAHSVCRSGAGYLHPGDLATDSGIALSNMTLAAWAKGVGSCIMGAIDRPALTALLGLAPEEKLAFRLLRLSRPQLPASCP